jgi:hypothetical protein
MPEPDLDAVIDWAGSGAMALTGRPGGPPLVARGRAATQVRRQLESLGVAIPGLLGERAAHAELRRNAPWSCGGSFRILPSADGHVGLSLARESDVELVPALVEDSVDMVLADPWAAVASWVARTSSSDAEARIRLLALPGCAVPHTPPVDRAGVVVTALGERNPHDEPLVVDLTSLWAGPLCAHLLGLRGAQVVKVESLQRPDGARFGSPAFFDLLHAGHRQITLDFTTELDQLWDLISQADLVLEGSRPRALRQLGLIAEEAVARGTSWLSITAHGRDSDAVGFGDDVAAAASLVADDDGEPLPAGDAVADPLTGVAAAVAAEAALASEQARLIDVSMLHVTAEAAVGEIPEHEVTHLAGGWQVEFAGGVVPVAEPRIR